MPDDACRGGKVHDTGGRPKTGPIVASRSLVLPYQGQTPRAPEGFSVTPFVTGLEHPRRLRDPRLSAVSTLEADWVD